MTPNDLDKLIEKYLAGDCTDVERDFIERWYSSLGKGLQTEADTEEGRPVSAAGDRMLSRVREHAESGPQESAQPRGRRSYFLYYTGLAASVVICIAAAFYFLSAETLDSPHIVIQDTTPAFTTAENSTSVPKRVILPDGSLVVMSPQSSIRYADDAVGSSRELFLEGEAYFDVAHNLARPFYVYAGNVITKVLGTSFFVRNRDNDEKITVSVKTGKVTVYSRKASHKKTVLTPNQEAVYHRATDLVETQLMPAQPANETLQTLTEMNFEETPVSQVLVILMNTYDIDIAFEEDMLSGCVLTSSFSEEGLYDRIDVICTAIGATYKIVDARIIIESKGCNLKPD